MTVNALTKPTRETRTKREPLDWRGFKFPRPTTVRDRKFAKDAIRTHRCGIAGRTDRVTHTEHKCGPKLDNGHVLLDPAHVPTGGHRALGKKAAERGGIVVLCRFAHMLQHALGWPSFSDHFDFDPIAEARLLARDYARRNGEGR